jgi:hypothetical protein
MFTGSGFYNAMIYMIGVTIQLLLVLLRRLLSSLLEGMEILQALISRLDSALRARALLQLLVPSVVVRVLPLCPS